MSASPSNSSASIPADGAFEALKTALGNDLLSTFCGLALYGVIVHQFYRYYRNFPSDGRFIRALIITVLILETGTAAVTMHYSYFFLIINYGNPEALVRGTWSTNILPLFSGLIAVFSQLFFICRVYMIGLRYRVIAAVATVLLISEIPIAIYLLHALFTNGLQDNFIQSKWLFETALLIPTIVDTIMTSTLIYVVQRSRAGLRRNDGIVDLMVIYGVNTGFLHWALNLGAFVTFATSSNPFLSQQFGPISIAVSRVYATTFLCVLNSRETTKSVEIFESGTYGLKVFERTDRRAAAEAWNVPQLPDDEPATINIRVTTELESERNWDGSKKPRGETPSSELDSTI